jgi:hypothetical protein
MQREGAPEDVTNPEAVASCCVDCLHALRKPGRNVVELQANQTRERLHWARAAIAAAGLAAFGTLLWAKAVPCGFATLTHHPCPGCGSTRAVVALLHGDLGGVLRTNPFGPFMAGVLGVLVYQAITSMLFDGDFRRVAGGRSGKVLTRVVIAIAALETILWVARFCGAFGGPVAV